MRSEEALFYAGALTIGSAQGISLDSSLLTPYSSLLTPHCPSIHSNPLTVKNDAVVAATSAAALTPSWPNFWLRSG